MREIKFRMFDRWGKMRYSGPKYGLDIFFADLFIDSEHDAMQFTGLKDKDGKEIYEGDVKRTLHFIAKGKKHYLYHSVQWSDKFAGWIAFNLKSADENDGSPQLWVYLRGQDAEVIGNIYENPELLQNPAAK